MKNTTLLTLIVAGLSGPLWAEAQVDLPAEDLNVATADTSIGEEIYKDVCKNCHGRTGKGMASFPKLAGSDADYLVSRLTAYRAGEKIGPNSPLMWPVAEELSDAEIAGLTSYIITEFK